MAQLDTATSAPRAPVGAILGPLPVWAVVALGGAQLGERVALIVGQDGSLRTVATWSSFAAALVAVIALFGVASGSRRSATLRRTGAADASRAGAIVALIAVAAVSFGGVMLRVDTVDRGLLPALADRGGRVDVEVQVVQEPRPIARGWQVLVRVERIGGISTRERATYLTEDEPPPLGQRLVGVASAQPLPEGGYGRWLARQHATAVLTGDWVPVGEPGPLARWSEAIRSRVRTAATRHLDGPTGGLLVGFVTGDTRLIPDDDRDAMQTTGLTHLTAVSGSNVAVVVGGVLALAAVVRIGARGRRWAIGLTVAWFAFVTRFEPSVLRAGTMAGILLLAGARGVPRDARHALSAAVLLLVVIDPMLAASLGLLLSATATAGVLVVAPRVRERIPGRLPARLAELLSLTIGAQIAVVPLLLTTFGELSLASVPANLVAVPAAAVAASLAFLGTAFLAVHVEIAALLFTAAAPAASVVRWAAHTFDGLGATITLDRPLGVLALACACGWVVVRPGARLGRPLIATAVVLSLVAAAPAALGRLPARDFTITAIDVGQGDAFLVETPGARILVDAGADATAAQWLRRNGRTWLDVVVVSHPHLDHVGGVPEVLRRIDVGVVWANPIPTELPQASEVLEVAHERAVPVRTPTAGDLVAVGDVTIEVLHPPPGRPYRWEGSELNETSYVLRVHHGERRVLLTGEVELTAQAALLDADRARLRAEAMTVPHHGAGTSDPDFLGAIGAEVALIGVGAGNRHGHPHPLTLAVLASEGVEVVRTDLDGTTRVAVPYARQHASRPAHRRRRRPPAPARGRASAVRPARTGPGADRRHLRRVRAGAPAGATDHLAVRRADLRGTPGRRVAVR